jgi:Phage portal protein
VGLLERVADEARSGRPRREERSSIDLWLDQYLIPAVNQFSYGGNNTLPFGVNTTYGQLAIREITSSLPGYTAALRTCPPAFAAQMVRALTLAGVRFVFRNPPWHPSTPRRVFGSSALAPLERPWRNAVTGDLVGRMEWHEGLAGNSYVHRRAVPPGPNAPTGVRLRVLRPDWVGILYGSELEPDNPAHALDGELLGYAYANGGFAAAGREQVRTLLPEDVAHWAPIPDPENAGIGQSWITPAVKEMMADRATTDHKLAYFRHGATPNLVVKGLPVDVEQFREIVELLEEQHAGVANAYRTLYLSQGADVVPVGANLADLDLKTVQGASETRISMLSRVHPVILAAAEGLQGSALNAGNFGMARRIYADAFVYPMLQNLAASVASLVPVPPDAELWYDVVDMPLLREDAKDAADIVFIQAQAIRQLVDGGFNPDSAVSAVVGQSLQQLQHSGLVSVQLNPPGTGQQPTMNGQGGGRSIAQMRLLLDALEGV